ncbi:hypothetical protein EYC80_009297 [Monilinia laxa]|uniref:Carrier domain-containing protein n=1 Tax=Monilinia laxa TaxID=61186 RepID=A0A5N6JXI3_MONLA|nr:hypothetical protein EYC80_009297 [Monilinia laxa]
MSQNSQEPIAIVGFACRLPGGNTNPKKLWEFLERGGIASNKVPKSRFNVDGHWDGPQKPCTMRPCGGMFLEDIDPADFDASFFQISRTEAISMDPNQRQMLEVVFEGLENAGIPLESINGAPIGCFVGSYQSDYCDMQNRDPEDRAAGVTINAARAILANRLSYFLNVKGPSMTIATACSGSLVGLDVACRYLHSREINAAIIASSNLYLNPEHGMDLGSVKNTHSPTSLCHTFDIDADGYVKAEAVTSIIVKRLSDAIRDRDPIRAVIRGSATNSDGRTPGIASPSAEAQSAAIRAAYANAGITNLNDTTYLECHGTGTQAGDPIEVEGAAAVFSATRSTDKPLIIGSIKSNIGHSEPSAGISGILKTVMAMENGIIPGNPTFIKPSPKIDFAGLKVKASRGAIPWPETSIRRASLNSFGYGGSNAHVILEQPSFPDGPHHTTSYLSDSDDFTLDDDDSEHPYTLIVSANDNASLKANNKALCNHMINPGVKANLEDLAYTLSERRTKLWHRAYITTRNTNIDEYDFVKILKDLDDALQSIPDPPNWFLLRELTEVRTAEHFRQPEFSQPLVTALQLCIIEILQRWGIKPQSVVGHSSGEIAAAYAAGFLDQATAIRAAYYRGRAAVNRKHEADSDVGMLAVGLGAEALSPYLEKHTGQAWIACFNSPRSLTVSGKLNALEPLAQELKADGHFARLLQVDLAYHSELMGVIGEEYEELLKTNFACLGGSSDVTMFSSVTGSKKTATADALYWKTNMISPVRFDEALSGMLSDENAPKYLIEIGPSGALAGPVSQVLKSLPDDTSISYSPSWSRGQNAGKTIFELAGRLFVAGHDIIFTDVNQYTDTKTIIDLPNYTWNHSVKYWHENKASKDWRFKQFLNHDLLGSKIIGTTWKSPTWRKLLNLADVPWLKDHKMGSDILMPGSGFIAMAVEALYQKTRSNAPMETVISSPNELSYQFKNIRFDKALVLEDDKESAVLLTMTQQYGSKDWQEFRIFSTTDDLLIEHCSGLIRLQDPVDEMLAESDSSPLNHPTPGKVWYKAQAEASYSFGPSFQKLLKVESTSGQRQSRAQVSLVEPESKWSPQSHYPIHPASIEGCFQTVTPALWAGERSSVNAVLVPSIIDELTINSVPTGLKEGLSLATSEYSGRGRLQEAKSYFGNCSVYHPETGALLLQISGLRFAKLDMGIKPDPHVFDCISWKPDITFFSQEQLVSLDTNNSDAQMDTIINLIAHKKPALRILEFNISINEMKSIWLESEDSFSRSAYIQYDFATYNSKELVSIKNKYQGKVNTSFVLVNHTIESVDLPQEAIYDLVILKVAKAPVVDQSLNETIKYVKSHLASKGYALVVQKSGSQSNVNSVNTPPVEEKSESPLSAGSPQTPRISADNSEYNVTEIASPGMPSTDKFSQFKEKPLESDVTIAGVTQRLSDPEVLLEALKVNGISSVLQFASKHESSAWSLYTHEFDDKYQSQPKNLSVVRFSETTPSLDLSLKAALEACGWNITELAYSSNEIAETGTVVLVLDELYVPVLTKINETQWEALKLLISSGNQLLWVTKGAQYKVTDPDNALVHGIFRVACREDTSVKLSVLDVESSTGAATNYAIETVLKSLHVNQPDSEAVVETEFVERNSILYVHRVVPDLKINEFKRAEREGAESVLKGLHETESAVQLRAEHLRTFQGLTWVETAVGEVPVEPGKIEVEVEAVGVNSKDVAVIMGVIPENEYTTGYEAAGVVKRLGPGVTRFKVGDRVCFLNSGSYVNRLQVGIDRAHIIPDSMNFEDAATIPSVYLRSIYSLYDIANLREGQSLLIHSASGGVGIACIQLVQYKKAEIYVTVDTEEKRKFLTENYGIPPSRMFSSRNTKFAKQILSATSGLGVDVIINSLEGELLNVSWKIVADGGTMFEIGKKDIIDLDTLSMEPFHRNCSFRAMDFSCTENIVDPLIERLLHQIFELLDGGHIKPIHPVTVFGFDNIPAALEYIHSGRQIGKVVVSDKGKKLQVPIRPATRKLTLRSDASYLIVGGLKGLCGSLAIHMARHGAKNIIACSRSGINDIASQKIVANCLAYGYKIVDAQGDATSVDPMSKVFKDASPQIAGIIQGAMILRDRPLETMTLDDYHNALHAKINGTWNLHNISQEQKESLDFFTLLSSISGIVGNKGQANYSAGNTFLDAFAHYRQSLGLRANSVDLSLIEDVGWVAEQDGFDSRFDKRQWTPVTENTLRKILSYSILQQDEKLPLNASSTTQLIAGIGFPLPQDSDLVHEGRFGYLLQNAGNGADKDSDASHGDETIQAFHIMRKPGADKGALVKICVEVIAVQFTKVLRLETEIETAKPLTSYGLDSLAAIELRNWIRIELGVKLTSFEITSASSLIALCEILVSKLR